MKKATALYQSSKVTMPKMSNISAGFVSSISEPNSPVKLKIKDVTESRQTGAKGSGNIPSLVTQPAGKIKVSDLFSYVKKKETDAAIAENPSPGTNRSTASVSAISVTDSGEIVKKSATKTAEKYLREPADWAAANLPLT